MGFHFIQDERFAKFIEATAIFVAIALIVHRVHRGVRVLNLSSAGLQNTFLQHGSLHLR